MATFTSARTLTPLSPTEEEVLIATRLQNDERPLRKIFKRILQLETPPSPAPDAASSSPNTNASGDEGRARAEAWDVFRAQLKDTELIASKAAIVGTMEASMRSQYAVKAKEIDASQAQLRAEILELKAKLLRAEEERRHKMEYDEIAKRVLALGQPDDFQKEISLLTDETESLRATHGNLVSTLAARKVAFDAVVLSLDAIRAIVPPPEKEEESADGEEQEGAEGSTTGPTTRPGTALGSRAGSPDPTAPSAEADKEKGPRGEEQEDEDEDGEGKTRGEREAHAAESAAQAAIVAAEVEEKGQDVEIAEQEVEDVEQEDASGTADDALERDDDEEAAMLDLMLGTADSERPPSPDPPASIVAPAAPPSPAASDGSDLSSLDGQEEPAVPTAIVPSPSSRRSSSSAKPASTRSSSVSKPASSKSTATLDTTGLSRSQIKQLKALAEISDATSSSSISTAAGSSTSSSRKRAAAPPRGAQTGSQASGEDEDDGVTSPPANKKPRKATRASSRKPAMASKEDPLTDLSEP